MVHANLDSISEREALVVLIMGREVKSVLVCLTVMYADALTIGSSLCGYLTNKRAALYNLIASRLCTRQF